MNNTEHEAKKIKVIFLDIDGVLNVIPQGRDKYGSMFHKEFVGNLARLISYSGAKIVISSTWRFDGLQKMKDMWMERRLPGVVIDITPDCAQLNGSGIWETKERGYEIQEWLDAHPEVTDYVIIDDDKDMLESQMKYFVKCSDSKESDSVEGYGLTAYCTHLALGILCKI